MVKTNILPNPKNTIDKSSGFSKSHLKNRKKTERDFFKSKAVLFDSKEESIRQDKKSSRKNCPDDISTFDSKGCYPTSSPVPTNGSETNDLASADSLKLADIDESKPALYENEYVENNLIAYIGNKRRLLPLITRALSEIEKNESKKSKTIRFLDCFSGTGVVSRLAKSLGFSVISNDWEAYTHPINKAFLLNDKDVWSIFADEGGIDQVLQNLNGQKRFVAKNSYIAKYYCPKSYVHVDVSKERLFYTRQNGILIDNIRTKIEQDYPPTNGVSHRKRDLLLAMLIIQASKRSNTSGVFKAFHHGFGGRKGDALNRILHPVHLEKPKLGAYGGSQARVYQKDALALVRSLQNESIDIAYLDPPYNQHQYGSNYHLLNTVALWDKPPINESYWVAGKKVDKGGIRKDWVKTKSTFCYAKTAKESFEKLVFNIQAKYLMLSYSTEGIIPFPELISILSKKGRVGIVTESYVRFRGGRQSDCTKKRNLEFIIIVDVRKKCRKQDIDNVMGIVDTSHLDIYNTEPMPILPSSDEKVHISNDGDISLNLLFEKEKIVLPLDSKMRLSKSACLKVENMQVAKRNRIIKKLADLYNAPNHCKIEGISHLIELGERSQAFKTKKLHCNFLRSELVRLLNKINPKKTPQAYRQAIAHAKHFGLV